MSLLVEVAQIAVYFFLWMMLGRIALGFLSFGKRTFFTELFEKATMPVFWVVRRITPASVGDRHIPWLSLPLLLALLIMLSPVPGRAS